MILLQPPDEYDLTRRSAYSRLLLDTRGVASARPTCGRYSPEELCASPLNPEVYSTFPHAGQPPPE